MGNNKHYDLEQRLIKFAVNIINYTETVKRSFAGQHLVKQIIRSATAPALNYAEAQSGESKKDFVHKIKIVLKELRETKVNLTIIADAGLITNSEKCTSTTLIDECDQLIAIFVASIRTASSALDNNSKVFK